MAKKCATECSSVFPYNINYGGTGVYCPGISYRDFFAMNFLHAMIRNTVPSSIGDKVAAAYEYADAMILYRNENPE